MTNLPRKMLSAVFEFFGEDGDNRRVLDLVYTKDCYYCGFSSSWVCWKTYLGLVCEDVWIEANDYLGVWVGAN
jgi:hypothetical protein